MRTYSVYAKEPRSRSAREIHAGTYYGRSGRSEAKSRAQELRRIGSLVRIEVSDTRRPSRKKTTVSRDPRRKAQSRDPAPRRRGRKQDLWSKVKAYGRKKHTEYRTRSVKASNEAYERSQKKAESEANRLGYTIALNRTAPSSGSEERIRKFSVELKHLLEDVEQRFGRSARAEVQRHATEGAEKAREHAAIPRRDVRRRSSRDDEWSAAKLSLAGAAAKARARGIVGDYYALPSRATEDLRDLMRRTRWRQSPASKAAGHSKLYAFHQALKRQGSR